MDRLCCRKFFFKKTWDGKAGAKHGSVKNISRCKVETSGGKDQCHKVWKNEFGRPPSGRIIAYVTKRGRQVEQ